MRVKDKIKYFIVLISLVASWINIAYASSGIEVDLSSLSAGNQSSHNCILEDKYNETDHWQECLICKYKANVQEHTLNIKYKNGVNSCNPSNRKITYCRVCNYEKSEPYIGSSHTGLYIVLNKKSGLSTSCRTCGCVVYSTLNGDEFYYLNGTEVDPFNISLPTTIKDKYGFQSIVNVNINTSTDESYADYSLTIDDNNEYATIEGYFYVPDELVGTSLTEDNIYMVTFGCTYGSGDSGRVDPVVESSSMSGNKIYFKFRFKLRDYRLDYSIPGKYEIHIALDVPIGNGAYERYQYCIPYRNLLTNFIDPVISTAE